MLGQIFSVGTKAQDGSQTPHEPYPARNPLRLTLLFGKCHAQVQVFLVCVEDIAPKSYGCFMC